MPSITMASSLVVLTGCSAGCQGFVKRQSFGIFKSPVLRVVTPVTRLIVRASTDKEAIGATDEKSLTGVVFEPLRELEASQLLRLPKNPQESLARHRFSVSCESAINEQINVEYNMSYIYHALFAYFDRDNVALPGLAKYFQEQSKEERGHAEQLMTYQNKRGGKVKLQSLVLLPMEFANAEKGDALYAMELALSLEKLTTEKLYGLHQVAEEANDVELTHYVEGEFLTQQIESIKEISQYVAQLRRIGNDGHGVYHWDRVLLEKGS